MGRWIAWVSCWNADSDSFGLEWSLRFYIFYKFPWWCWCYWSVDHSLKGRRLEVLVWEGFWRPIWTWQKWALWLNSDVCIAFGPYIYLLFWLRSNPVSPALCRWEIKVQRQEMASIRSWSYLVTSPWLLGQCCFCYLPTVTCLQGEELSATL